ncbi:hypothetical protein IU501_19870 [Nocardia otitidiscaviarum]|uniref:hypothetical protein n=1 Tax=Nocardia otitidiscaviarum TaxID=1823 RepID=UPI0018957D7F|nr:hypothetical protein [Nocardia otitidiscaviarum]MBF6135246.1 hypothetical protein [Nocardia otitidiscaviarum]
MHELPPVAHSAVPDSTLTPTRAHRIMQDHRGCPVSVCPAKAQAKRLLIEAGKLVPADAPHVGS